MGTFTAGAIVLVRFPFSDLTRSKLRPAVVLAEIDNNDVILCQITSKPYADENAIDLSKDSFAQGSLNRISYVRPGKIFTASSKIIVRQVAKLKPSVRQTIVDSIITIIQ